MQKMQSTPRLQQQLSKMRTQPHCIEIYPPFQYRYDDFNPSTRDITGSYLHTALVKHEKESDSLVTQVKKAIKNMSKLSQTIAVCLFDRMCLKIFIVAPVVQVDKAYLFDIAYFINGCSYVN